MRIGLFTALSFGHEMHSLPVRIFQHDRQHRLACWRVGVALGDVPWALGLAITPTVASAVCEWPLTGNTGNRMLPTRASIERRKPTAVVSAVQLSLYGAAANTTSVEEAVRRICSSQYDRLWEDALKRSASEPQARKHHSRTGA